MATITVTSPNTGTTSSVPKRRRNKKNKSKTVVEVLPSAKRTRSRPRPRKNYKANKSALSMRGPNSSLGEFTLTVAKLEAAKNSCIERVTDFLLGKSALRKGFVYNRDDQRPVFQKLFPFTVTLTPDLFDLNTRLAFNIHPNPYRTLEMVIPPVGSNRSKDITETISFNSHIPNSSTFCFDHPITLLNGSLTSVNHPVKGIDGAKHWSDTDEELKDGNKIYLSGPSTFNVEPAVSVNNVATYAVHYTVRFQSVLNGQDGYEIGAYAEETFTVSGNSNTNLVINAGFGAFATAMSGLDCAGFAILWTMEADDGEVITTTGSNFNIHLSQNSNDPGKFPIFGSAHTWRMQSVFDLIGNPSNALKAELDNSDQIAVTAYALLLTNYTAPLNKAGKLFGAEVPADHTKSITAEPGERLNTLFQLPNSPWKMAEIRTLDKGTHFSSVATKDHAQFLPSGFYRDADKAQYNRPFASVCVDGAGAFEAGSKPNLQLSGWLNVEWRGTSMTFAPIMPPANLGLFVDVLDSVLAHMDAGALWSENPAHESKIRKIAHDVVTSKRFKTVIRDVAIIGVGALAAVFI